MSGSVSTSTDGGSGSDPYGSSSISGSSGNDDSYGHTSSGEDSRGSDSGSPTSSSDSNSNNSSSGRSGRSSRRRGNVKRFKKDVKKYVEKHGCSKREAKRAVNKARRRKMMKVLFRLLKVKKLIFNDKDDLGTPPSRLNKMDEIFNFTIENCENWRGLNDAINVANDNKKKKNNFSNVFNLDWPRGLLPLYFYKFLNYELEKILVNNVKKGKNEFELKYLMDDIRSEHRVLMQIFMEDIVLQGGEASAKQFLQEVLLLYLKPEENKTLFEFYNKDKSRRYMNSNINDNNDNNNNNNKSSNSNSGITGKKRSFNNYSSGYGRGRATPADLCYYFNFGTCNRGSQCALTHACVVCTKKYHGALKCNILFKKFKYIIDKKGRKSDNYSRDDYDRRDQGRYQRQRRDGREFDNDNNWGSGSNSNVDAALQGLRLALQSDGKKKGKNGK